MRKINVADRTQIKQILRARGVLGVADGQQQESGVLQLWWHNTEDGVCDCCESRWTDPERETVHVNLNKALRILWRNRGSLYLCGKYSHDGRAPQSWHHS